MTVRTSVPTILLCDDCPEVRGAIRMMLEGDLKAIVKECDSGHEGINILKSENIDLVISDYNMGESRGTGLDVFRYILRMGLQCPFFLFSGSQSDFSQYLDYPTFKYFNKIELEELRKQVSQYFYGP